MQFHLKTNGARSAAIRLNSGRGLWAPIIVLETYLAFTVFVFFFGPVAWHLPSVAKLVTFLVINYGGLWLGYSLGLRRKKIRALLLQGGEIGVIKASRRLMPLILFSMIFTIFSGLLRLYVLRGDIASVLATLLNPGEAYAQAQLIAQMDRDGAMMDQGTFAWGFRITTLLAVFNGLYFPLAILCWQQMTFAYRALFFITLLCMFLFTIGAGAQSGFGFMLFSLVPVALYKLFITARPNSSGVGGSNRRMPRGPRRLRTLLMIGASLCVFVSFLVFFQSDRVDNVRSEVAEDMLVGAFGEPAKDGLLVMTGEPVIIGVVMLCKYVSHGYEGLALSMELPFEWTYGLGWSKALQVIWHDYLGGSNVFEKSYLWRNEASSGWPALQWWSTIFPWIASDTTYFGTVVVMAFIGFVLGRVWTDVVLTGNPIGFAFLAQMFILVFMFPANNALAQSLDGLFALIGITIMYAMSRRYFKPRLAANGGRAEVSRRANIIEMLGA